MYSPWPEYKDLETGMRDVTMRIIRHLHKPPEKIQQSHKHQIAPGSQTMHEISPQIQHRCTKHRINPQIPKKCAKHQESERVSDCCACATAQQDHSPIPRWPDVSQKEYWGKQVSFPLLLSSPGFAKLKRPSQAKDACVPES